MAGLVYERRAVGRESEVWTVAPSKRMDTFTVSAGPNAIMCNQNGPPFDFMFCNRPLLPHETVEVQPRWRS